MYTHIYVHLSLSLYIYIYIERERYRYTFNVDADSDKHIHTLISIRSCGAKARSWLQTLATFGRCFLLCRRCSAQDLSESGLETPASFRTTKTGS